MEAIAAYSDDEAGVPSSPGEPVKLLEVSVSAAPQVDTAGFALVDNRATTLGNALHLQPASARMIKYNLPVDQMHAPIYGPAHPSDKGGVPQALRNHRAGHVEDAHLSTFTFDEQYNTFHSYGYAQNPTGTGFVAHREGTSRPMDAETVYTLSSKRQRTEGGAAAAAATAAQKQPAQVFDPTQPFALKTRQPWADKETAAVELTEEQKTYMEQVKADKMEKEAVEGKADHSIFHGKAEKDYQGRSWVEAPKDKKKESDACFLPKRHIHTWSGHSKGVNAIRFFPGTGHLLLSAGLDGKIKIWDVYNNRQCMRTYLGHSKGVRDICFSNDGRRFVSTGYDRVIKYWDTETGKVLGSYGEGKLSYTVKLHPDDDKQNVLMAGTHDKKIMQWDMDSGDLVQEYDYHLGAVNTVTFIDNNRRFVSTSDDKTIRVWEFGIPVQVKYIADPSMHAIASVGLSPNKKWWCGQSMDNQIITYSATDRVKLNSKKTFKGHVCAGYACQVSFSPDGKYVMSGEGDGKLFVWDWKNCKILRSLKAHDGVCIGCEWHPLESSKVATCGWDGLIKYWD